MPSLWDSFSGAGAAKAARRSEAEAAGHLNTGMTNALGAYNTGYTSATGRINPFLQSGQGANQLYSDFLGVNGRPAQSTAFANYQQSPGWQAELDARQSAIARAANARGGFYSGNALNAAANEGQQYMRGNFENYMNRLGGFAQQGAGMAQFGAGLDTQNANSLASLHYGNAQQLAGNAINRGNAEAQASGTLMSNILGLGSLGISAFNAFNPIGVGAKTAASNNFSNFSRDPSFQGYGMGIR